MIASILMLPLHTAAVLPSGGCGLGGIATQSILRQTDQCADCCAL